jgi:hypothetical protein
MTIEEFIQKYNGRYLDYDGKYGCQCKDLFSFYNEEVVENPHYVRGNAINLWDNAPKEYYQKVGSPKKGDVVIWNYRPYGHVGVYVEGTTGSFTSFDQNYPPGTPCHLQKHKYVNIVGYLRPNNLINKDILEELNMNLEELKKELSKDFVKKDVRFNMDKHGATWIVDKGKKYKYGDMPDDDKILANQFCKERLSKEEAKYPRAKNRGDVL